MFDKFKKRLTEMETREEDLTFKPWVDDEKGESIPTHTREGASDIYVKNEQKDGTNVELKVMRPESYEEVSDVADNLLAGCTVVLNVEALDRAVIFRMLDFLNGVTYCTDGEIKKVAQNTFIITPHSNVDISDM
jgi:cell division inhibitor SepF